MKTIRKQLNFTDVMEEKVEEIRDKHGLPSFTAAIHYCVANTHKGEFKDYVITKQSGARTEDEKLQDKENAELVRIQRTYDKQALICSSLDGEITEKDGTHYCTYHTYTRSKRYEQVLPLSELISTLADKQYLPSKEVVEKLQAEGKVKY